MSSAQAPAGQPVKAMSSRLLTMKFMQRAAASSPQSDVSPPEQSASKRRKVSENGHSTPPSTNRQAVQAALAEEEAKREEALERQGNMAGETKWVLSFKEGDQAGQKRQPLRVVKASYAMIDSPQETSNIPKENDEPWRQENVVGRRSFGKFNRELEKSQKASDQSESESSSETSLEDESEPSVEDDNDTGANAMIRQAAKQQERAERKAKRKAEKVQAERLAELAETKTVNLKKLTSISSGGGVMGSKSDITCHKCGKKGHIQRECPENPSQKPRKRDRNEEDIPYRHSPDSKKKARR